MANWEKRRKSSYLGLETHPRAAPVLSHSPGRPPLIKLKVPTKRKADGPAEPQSRSGFGPIERDSVTRASGEPCDAPGASTVAASEKPETISNQVNTEIVVSTAYASPTKVTKVDAKLDRKELIRFREGKHADIVIELSTEHKILRTWKAHKFILSRSELLERLCEEEDTEVANARMGFFELSMSRETFELIINGKKSLPVLEISHSQLYHVSEDLVDALLVFLYAKGLEPIVANRIGGSFVSVVGLILIAAEAKLSGLSKLATGMLHDLCVTKARSPLKPNDSPGVGSFCQAVRLAYESTSRHQSICTTQDLLAEFAYATRGTLSTSDAIRTVVMKFPEFGQHLGLLGMGLDKPRFNPCAPEPDDQCKDDGQQDDGGDDYQDDHEADYHDFGSRYDPD